MKRPVTILLALIMLLCITGCGTKQTEPSKNTIKDDLQNQLTEFQTQSGNYHLDVLEHEVIKSLTEDKTYSAQINVTAKSQYAEFYYIAEVAYTLYDQGWAIDSCEWEMLDYEVVAYPSEEELSFLLDDARVLSLESRELNHDGDLFFVSGINKLDWCPYFIGEEYTTLTYQYNISNDQWDHYDSKTGETVYKLTSDFEKAWAKNVTDPGMKISNVTETGFEISTDNQSVRAKSHRVELDVTTTNEINKYSGEDFYMCFRSEGNIDVTDVKGNYAQSGQLGISVLFYREPKKSSGNTYDMMCSYALTTNGTDTLYPHMSYHLVN